MDTPAAEFASFALEPDLLETLTQLGFTKSTPIQAAGLPAALEGRDPYRPGLDGERKDDGVRSAPSDSSE